ncbi:MAG: aromatic-ring-hydroxylating dioxygenase subunit beta [Alphaproteobacteria bacterium]|nr:aromatic-ring-hydroxylating dioxygenase subunit beta [Alphaproteobacteria bacterium]
MVSRDIRNAIVDLESAYAACLDDDRLEAWPDFFTADCVYHITTRETVDDGYSLGLFYCHNRAQVSDRVKILRNAAVFSVRYYRHLVSNVRVVGEAGGVYAVEAAYAVFATDQLDGITTVFSAGKYRDKVVFAGGVPKFKEKVVIADTASIPANLSVPL